MNRYNDCRVAGFIFKMRLRVTEEDRSEANNYDAVDGYVRGGNSDPRMIYRLNAFNR